VLWISGNASTTQHRKGEPKWEAEKHVVQVNRTEAMDLSRAVIRDRQRVLPRRSRVVEEFAAHATVPVINGLTDLLHPCQVLTDMFTVQEAIGDLEHRVVAWIGDGNNMANSWLNAAATMGFELRLACPEGYEPDRDILTAAEQKTKVTVTRDLQEAVSGSHVVNTDVWASMGQEGESEVRAKAFEGYSVDRKLMELAAADAIFLHCLPVHRGEEVEEEVFEGPQSRVFDQAENRLHVQKALMAKLLG